MATRNIPPQCTPSVRDLLVLIGSFFIRRGKPRLVAKWAAHQDVGRRMTAGQVRRKGCKPRPARRVHIAKKTKSEDEHAPPDRQPPNLQRIALNQMDHCGNGSGASRDRHTNKIFTSRTAWVRRQRVYLNVEPRQPARPCQEENKGRDRAKLNNPRADVEISGNRQHAKSPRPSQYRWSNPKRDY